MEKQIIKSGGIVTALNNYLSDLREILNIIGCSIFVLQLEEIIKPIFKVYRTYRYTLFVINPKEKSKFSFLGNELTAKVKSEDDAQKIKDELNIMLLNNIFNNMDKFELVIKDKYAGNIDE